MGPLTSLWTPLDGNWGFSPSAADQKAIAQMGEELDGSPLAIRLTAGRLKELRPNEILNLLPHRLPLLANTQAQSARLDLALSPGRD